MALKRENKILCSRLMKRVFDLHLRCILTVCLVASLVTQSGCVHAPARPVAPPPAATVQESAQAERDEMFMQLAYAVAYKDWQTKSRDRRGYNIASVLVDARGRVVAWGRNCVYRTHNGTQHAEVRTILSYFMKRGAPAGEDARELSQYLSQYTIYTTLEPCAQCAGMMTFLRVQRVVYGQEDASYGKALERLEMDTSRLLAPPAREIGRAHV